MVPPLLTEADARALYAAGEAAHDFDHVLRVARLAVQIAAAEGAHVETVRLAALLHDLPADPALEPTDATARAGHHRAAAARAARLLHERGAPPEQIAAVAHCIQAHRFRDQSVQPATLEAQCLYDADKLDAMGAIGVLRAAAYAAHYGHRLWNEPAAAIEARQQAGAPQPVGKEYTPVHEFVYKLQRLYGTLHTETARALGRARHAAMAAFFAQLDAELAPLRDPPSSLPSLS